MAWRIKNDSVLTLLGGSGKNIPASANLNTLDYLTPGNYVCSQNTTANTLVNSPTSVAFKMTVYDCLGAGPDLQNGNYIYLVRTVMNLDGYRWVQYVHKETTWTYSSWRTVVDGGNFASYFNSNFSTSFSSSLSSTVKDYVVEQGEKDFWTYRKWNSGAVECWGNKSATPTTVNGTNTISVSLPFTFVGTGYTVDISPAKTGLYISAMGDCNANGDLAHTTSSFTMAYRYNSGTAYGVSFNLHVHGKWK